MNFTGHKRLTDEQFNEYYKDLFEASPRISDYETEEYKNKVELSRKRFFDFQQRTMDIDTLPWEIWKEHPNDKTWEISNLGRIKINGIIQEQIDNTDGSKGYLVLKNYTSYLVYHLVADTFLNRGKPGFEGLFVHHINNDGYNNSEDNLIMLTEKQHKVIHRKEMEEW